MDESYRRSFEAELRELADLCEKAKTSHPVGTTDIQQQIARILPSLQPGGPILDAVQEQATKQKLIKLAREIELMPTAFANPHPNPGMDRNIARGAYTRIINMIEDVLKALVSTKLGF